MKIVFFGTSEFAAPALKALLRAGYDVQAVVTLSDKKVGRKKILTSPPIKNTALELGISVFQPESLKDDSFFESFKNWQPDFCVVAAYGKLIPLKYLDFPRFGFLNIHPSLLPKYRGPTPIQTAILNGDNETGVTIIVVDEEMDHGGILARREFKFSNPSTDLGQVFQFSNSKEIELKLSQLGAELLIEVLPKYISGEIKPKEQDHIQATFTKKFKREDGKVNWERPLEETFNQIRALSPEPGAWTIWEEKVLNIKSAKLSRESLVLERVQLEGGREMSAAEFTRGHPGFNNIYR